MNKAAAAEHQVTVGMLEFKETPEYFEKLGRLVWDILKRPESERCYLEYKGQKLHCQECVVHGT